MHMTHGLAPSSTLAHSAGSVDHDEAALTASRPRRRADPVKRSMPGHPPSLRLKAKSSRPGALAKRHRPKVAGQTFGPEGASRRSAASRAFALTPSAILVALALAGCSTSPGGGAPWKIEPVYRTTHATPALLAGSAAAYAEVAELFSNEGRHEQAAHWWARATQVSEPSPEHLTRLGASLLQLRRFDEAVATMSRVVALQPQDASALNNLAYAHAQRGEHVRSRELLLAALALQPDYERARKNLAWVDEIAARAAPVMVRKSAPIAPAAPAATAATAATAAMVATAAAPPTTPTAPTAATTATTAPVAPAVPEAPTRTVQAPADKPSVAQEAASVPASASTPSPASTTDSTARGAIVKMSAATEPTQPREAAVGATQAAVPAVPVAPRSAAAAVESPTVTTAAAASAEPARADAQAQAAADAAPNKAQTPAAADPSASVRPEEPASVPTAQASTAGAAAGESRMPAEPAAAAAPAVLLSQADLAWKAPPVEPRMPADDRGSLPDPRLAVLPAPVIEPSGKPDPAVTPSAPTDVRPERPVPLPVPLPLPQPLTTGQASAAAPGAGLAALRLAVVNGNGTRGAAAAVGAYLGGQGWPQARFQNLRPYRVVKTVVEYREGFEAAAQALLQSLPEGTALRLAQAMDRRVDMRVVLGRDTATVALASCQMSGAVSGCVPARGPQAPLATNSLALGETRLAPAVIQPR